MWDSIVLVARFPIFYSCGFSVSWPDAIGVGGGKVGQCLLVSLSGAFSRGSG